MDYHGQSFLGETRSLFDTGVQNLLGMLVSLALSLCGIFRRSHRRVFASIGRKRNVPHPCPPRKHDPEALEFADEELKDSLEVRRSQGISFVGEFLGLARYNQQL